MPHLTVFLTLALALTLFSVGGWVMLNVNDDAFSQRRISVDVWRRRRSILGLALALIGGIILLAGALSGSALAA